MVQVTVRASDALSREGLASFLDASPGITVVDGDAAVPGGVLVVCCERLSAEVIAMLRLSAAETGAPVVLVVHDFTEADLVIAVECRVVAVLPRAAVSPERLAHSVVAAAAGGGVLPSNLVGELLRHLERVHREVLAPRGQNAAGLTPREVDVLRLMADGLDTNEIADALSYSQRTVKNVIYSMTNRLQLRNRSHAVAYAVRTGMI
ncbi:DNA-binding NarL/FixJ family response regulator [Actinoplanes lutulentus]|uniref:DNA-binding NarL/FixJ family response regulator n=1 Tax=Actinoplanes lutulentus TaxID=1287878 RepID=A0A327YYC9_9ACTN|nr:DNA-binding NarL/FixJ family response regulator [Actinoplanes lutulentus]